MDRREDGGEVAGRNLSSEETVADDNARDHEQHGLKQQADVTPAQQRANNGQAQNVHGMDPQRVGAGSPASRTSGTLMSRLTRLPSGSSPVTTNTQSPAIDRCSRASYAPF
jgi:hypothetical protein